MRLRYVFSAMVGVSALALSVMTPVGARAVRPDAATLKKIASRVDSRAGVVTIERLLRYVTLHFEVHEKQILSAVVPSEAGPPMERGAYADAPE